MFDINGACDTVRGMTATQDKTEPEDAVRLYLLWLDDPNKLRNETEIQNASKAVQDATDPIDKLKALAQLQRVSTIDKQPLREGFVTHAKVWADQAGIPASAFRDLKVPDDVLREAGFGLPTGRRRGRGTPASANGRQRAKAVPVENIKAYVLNQKGSFILTDIMGGIGGSQATVRKAIDELIESGQVEKLGPVPDYAGRGRAPIQYNRS
jgi:hypothetical protein